MRALRRFSTTPLPGVCGVPWATSPASLSAGATHAAALAHDLVAVLSRPAPPSVATLHALDTISDSLCKVLDLAEFLRCNHADGGWREAAAAVHTSLGSVLHTLNTCSPLYDALAALVHSPGFSGLSVEERRMALSLKAEFERDGIHLPPAQRAALVSLNDAASEAASAFVGGIAVGTRCVEVPAGLVSPHLPPGVAAQLGGGGTLTLPSDPGLVGLILRTVPDEGVRREMMTLRDSDSAHNLPALLALRETRHAVAVASGHDSYAALVAGDRLAGSPAAATSFLTRLSRATLPRAAREFAELIDVKRGVAAGLSPTAAAEGVARHPRPVEDVWGNVRSISTSLQSGTSVQPWDVPFLQAALSSARWEPQGAPPLSSLSTYFRLDRVLGGLTSLIETVFGVRLTLEPVPRECGWDVAGGGWGGATSPSLLCYRVAGRDGGDLGTMYLDLFPRPHKFGGAAHFVVRCGKEVHPEHTPHLPGFEARVHAARGLPPPPHTTRTSCRWWCWWRRWAPPTRCGGGGTRTPRRPG